MLSRFLWLWLPLLWIVAQIGCEIFLGRPGLEWLLSENGLYELLQFAAIFAAFLAACRILWRMDRRAHPWLFAWIAVAALASFYIAGEEISWGQQFLHWSTPEEWAALNDQDETNLHNTSSWLDQKPRWVLQIGMFVGGLLIPLLRRVRPAALPARFSAIYPSDSLAPVAGIAALVKIVNMAARELFGVSLFFRASEVIELYMFYFVLLYLLDFWNRSVKNRIQQGQ